MEIIDRLLEHDAAATGRLLALCAELPEEQWLRTFEFGQGSVYGTFDHMIDSMEFWTSLMQGEPSPFVPAPVDPERRYANVLRRFEVISSVFVALARRLRDENRLNETFVDLETGPARRSYGACITHVVTHNMHHRAQIRVMFDLMGVEYNPFSGFAMDAYPLEPTDLSADI